MGGQPTFTYLPTLSLVPSKTTEDPSLREKEIPLRAVQFFLPGEEAEVAARTGCPCPEAIPQGMWAAFASWKRREVRLSPIASGRNAALPAP